MAFCLGSASAREVHVMSAGELTLPAATAGGVIASGLGLAARYYQQGNYVQAEPTYRGVQASYIL
jgi:hypothetical protein